MAGPCLAVVVTMEPAEGREWWAALEAGGEGVALRADGSEWVGCPDPEEMDLGFGLGKSCADVYGEEE